MKAEVVQVSTYVFEAKYLGQLYKLTLGGPRGMWDVAQIEYMNERGRWERCTHTQADFITRAIERNAKTSA